MTACLKIAAVTLIIKNKTALCRIPGVVSFVGRNLGREDHHSGGWQSDHHGAWGPAGDWPVHDCAAESREQQGHPGYHNYARGPAESQTGQCAAAQLGAAARMSSVKLNPPSSRDCRIELLCNIWLCFNDWIPFCFTFVLPQFWHMQYQGLRNLEITIWENNSSENLA